MMPDKVTSSQDVREVHKIWENHRFLLHASLVSNGCRSAMILAGLSGYWQHKAHCFGRDFVFAWRLAKEIQFFNDTSNRDCDSFDLSSLPALLTLAAQKVSDLPKSSDEYRQLFHQIAAGNSLQTSQKFKHQYKRSALLHLSSFPLNSATDSLKDQMRNI